jgi:hypothetical protein
MRRREFIAGLACAAEWPAVACAQQRPAVPVIGGLSSRAAATDALVLPAFHRALNAQGFVEAQNVSVEYRYFAPQFEQLPALVAYLVGRRAAVIVTVGAGLQTMRAIQAASATLPIVGFAAAGLGSTAAWPLTGRADNAAMPADNKQNRRFWRGDA